MSDPLASRRLALLLVIPLASIATPALAGSPTLEAPEQTPTIYGGVPTEPCQWPMVISMQGSCSGTLVHPELVIYAAHCGDSYDSIWLGETIDAPTRVVPTEYCVTNPVFNNLAENTDFAFCKLAEPIEDITPVPILMGCETQLLQPGAEVVAVGFGFDEFDGYGVKRHVSFPIVDVIPSGEVEAGGNGFSICNGDSGGPLFMRLPESLDPQRSWRVFGVTSWGPFDCADPQFFGTMHAGVPWIEATSGIDITPCHNSDGSWQPGPGCTEFPLAPDLAQGAWPGCGPVQIGGKSASCGAPAPDEDLLPPTAAVLMPLDGAVFESDMGSGFATLDIVAEVADEGWGLTEVALLINGEVIEGGEKNTPPWVWNGAFPKGGYLVSVRATDLAGNVTESAVVGFGVDQEAPVPPEPEPEDGTEDGDTHSDDEVGTSGPAQDGVDDGCSCTSASNSGGAASLLALGLLGLVRRRRT